MKPVKLKIKGINSFTDEQIVDFEKLSKEGLFGIVGNTGSGKSSILDAMTIALYGELSKNTNEFINKEASTARVVFEFVIEDSAGERYYTVERSFKRTDKEEKKAVLARLTEGKENITVIADKTREVDKKIKELIGLSYEDFTRTVVLPQGKFSEFLLQIKGKERRMMLEKIFGLEKYGTLLWDKIRDEFSKESDKLNSIKSKIEVYGELNSEIYSEKEKELNGIKSILEKTKTEFAAEKEKLADAEKIFELAENIKKYNSELEKLEKEKKQLDEYAEKNNIFADSLTVNGLNKILNDFKQAEKLSENIKSEESKKKNAAISKKYSEENYNKSVENKNTLQLKLDELKKNEKSISEGLEELEKIKSDIAKKLFESSDRLNSANNLLNAKKNEYSEADKAVKMIAGLNAEINTKKKELEGTNKNIAKGNGIIEENNNNIDKTEKDIENLKNANIAAVLSARLSENEPCPVCGSYVHPNPAKEIETTVISAYESRLKKLKSNGEKYIKRLRELQGEKGNSEGIIKSKTEELSKYSTVIEGKNIDVLKAEYETEKEKYSELININNSLKKENDDVTGKYEMLLKQKKTAERNTEQYENKIKALDESIKNCESDIKICENKIISCDEIISNNKNEIRKLMGERNIDNIGNIIKETEYALEFVSDYSRRKNLAEDNIKDYKSQLGERYITKEELETVKNNVFELENKQTALSNSYAVVSKELVRMKENLSEVEKLNAELKKSSHRHDMLNELSKLVQGNKFVEYMAENQLRYIAADASERLKKISGGRYAIEILDGEFIIRDDFCGGRKRYPNTLSGGEVFLTSFALALSLSNRIQMRSNAPMRFFFLDEGFGTLDHNTLETVMNSLNTLIGSGMTVGVITHVDAVKEQLPVKLEVIPASPGEHGSIVKMIC